MADIFENAFVTIAALRGRSSDDGLRPLNADGFKVYKLEKQNLYLRTSVLGNLRDIGREVPHELDRNWPLLTRAWVHQEYQLSPRLLCFDVYQLAWKCDTAYLFEDEKIRRDPTHGSPSHHPRFRAYPRNLYDPVRAWHETITIYSAMKISFEHDRLPAIAALAQRMMQYRSSDEYCAGVWKSSLLHDLAWIPDYFECRPTSDAYYPSWSWASIYGKIYYEKYSSTEIAPHVKIVGLSYTPIGPAQIGKVEDAVLTLSGPCLNVEKIVAEKVNSRGDHFHLPARWASSIPHPNPSLSLDCDLSLSDSPMVGENFKAVFLLEHRKKCRGSYYGNVFGLILRGTSQGRFKRVGYILWDVHDPSEDEISEWFDDLRIHIAKFPVETLQII